MGVWPDAFELQCLFMLIEISGSATSRLVTASLAQVLYLLATHIKWLICFIELAGTCMSSIVVHSKIGPVNLNEINLIIH